MKRRLCQKMIYRSLLIGTVAFALMACRAGEAPTSAAWRTLSGAVPLVIAHRGASGYLPEHTLAAYELAICQGADIVEPDLVLTKDGVLVARHDRYLSTTTNVAAVAVFADRKRKDPDPNGRGRVDWWVEDFTLAEIKMLRARQSFPGRSKAQDDVHPVPTFDEVLGLVTRMAAAAKRPIGVYPETKHPSYFASAGLDFEQPLIQALRDFSAGPVFIQSFEAGILKRLKGKTNAQLVQLVRAKRGTNGPDIPLKEIAQYADGVGPPKKLIVGPDGQVSDFLRLARQLGLFVHPWTFRADAPNAAIKRVSQANAAPTLTELGLTPGILWSPGDNEASLSNAELAIFMALGVDGLFTDFPDLAVEARDAPNQEASANETPGFFRRFFH